MSMNVTQTLMSNMTSTNLPTMPSTTATTVTSESATMMSAAATTAATATTTLANTCVESTSKVCIKLVTRYNELAATATNSGIVSAVASCGLIVFGVSQFVRVCVEHDFGESRGKIRMLVGLISIMGGIGCAVGASLSIRYDNQEILDGCIK